MSSGDPRIIVALDFPEPGPALALAGRLDPAACRVKVGKQLFTRAGPEVVRALQDLGFDVFLDLKFHDIPNTVAGACRAAADLGVWMVNVHASGGRRMMEAAAESLAKYQQKPLLIAVTVLTSMSDDDLQELGIELSAADQALKLANMAKSSGLDGVVCSAQEATQMRQQLGQDFVLVTPGIRPSGSQADDQRRVMTPEQAIKAGSSYLVVGRPITQSDNPMSVLRTINSEISSLP